MILTGYFGDTEVVANKYRREDVINDALNTPVQMGTSEIIILTVNAILRYFYSLGYTSEDVSVYYVRHDEPVFKIKTEVLKDAWVFEQFATILIDDWTPLHLDFNYGYYYKVPDEQLEQKVQESIENNRSKIEVFKSGTVIDTTYYPIDPIFKLSLEKCKVADKTIIAVYNEELHAIDYHLVSSTDDAEVENFIKNAMRKKATLLSKAGYRGLLVCSDFFKDEDFCDDCFIRYSINNDKIAKVFILCEFMAYKYCKKNQLDNPHCVDWEANQEFLMSVGSLTEKLSDTDLIAFH
jgi:hypothetical protein